MINKDCYFCDHDNDMGANIYTCYVKYSKHQYNHLTDLFNKDCDKDCKYYVKFNLNKLRNAMIKQLEESK